MASVASQLAEAVTGQYQAGLPERILSKGKDLILNAAAVAIAGRDHPGWITLHDGWPARELPAPLPAGRPEIGRSKASPPETSRRLRGRPGASRTALLFTAAANMLDFDDGDIATLVHPTCVNLGAALGAAALADITGRDLLTACLIGCEIELRLARALTPEALVRGWDLNGVCGTISAAVTSALLLGASADVLANAVSIAASSTLGQLAAAGSMLKFYVIGKASANGVTSALLSRRGFTASLGALESRRGLGAALVQRPGAFDAVTGALGTEWLLDDVLIKRYPCAILLHPVIDAALQLRAAAPAGSGTMTPAVRCSPLTQRLTSRPRPADGLQARVSAQHCAVTALREGTVDLEHFTDVYTGAMRDEAAQVRVEADDRLSAAQAEVRGRWQPGTPDRPAMTEAFQSGLRAPAPGEVVAKARHVLRDPRYEGAAESLVTFISAIEQQPDVRPLISATCR